MRTAQAGSTAAPSGERPSGLRPAAMARCRRGRPAPPCRLAAWPRAATVRPPAGARGRRTQLPVPASATCRSRFSSRDFEEWGTVNGREREGLGSEQAGGRGSLLWAVIRVPKLVVYGLDHLFGLNLSSGIYLMYILSQYSMYICIMDVYTYSLSKNSWVFLGIPRNPAASANAR